MVLSQMNNIAQPASNCGCGTINKCSMCVYKLICERSPFCCIKNGGSGTCDLTPVLNAINQLGEAINNKFTNTDANIASIGAALNTMNSSINSIGAAINESNAKLDEILSKLNTSATVTNAIDVSNIEDIKDGENGIIPYSSEPDSVLVQKKTMFGKTKWVEEKKK